MKLIAKLKHLRALAPRRSRYGQMYKSPAETKGAWKRVTLWTLFESTEGTHLLRPHVFKKDTPMDARAWAAWFSTNLKAIQQNAVVPGINLRTNKIWRVRFILGWQSNVVSESRVAKVSRKRHQTKHKGGKDV